MPQHAPIGRHAAAPARSGTASRRDRGRRKVQSVTVSGTIPKWSKNAGVGLVAVGIIATMALPAAHAEYHKISPHPDDNSTPVASAQPDVTADAGANIDFSRSDISSEAAPGVGGPKLKSADSTGTGLAASGAAAPLADSESSAEAAPPSTTTDSLTAPLASLSVSSPFGYRTNPLTGAAGEMHTGVDYAGACSAPVLSAGEGVVVEAGFSASGAGNRIVVDHGNGLKTTYNHLATIGASVGQPMARGQQIAGVGTTGASTGCHLHFEVMVNDQVVNPNSWI